MESNKIKRNRGIDKMEGFRTYLERNGIDTKLVKEMESIFRKKQYPKCYTLLNMGEHTQFIYFIVQGMVRGFYVDVEGKEITKCFAKENEWCCVYNMLQEQASEYWIETLEDCELIELDVEYVKRLICTESVFQNLYTRLCTEAFIQSDVRSSYFQKMTAKERYKCLLNQQPDLIERVKQEQIASYIGITPTSLSRLKREL